MSTLFRSLELWRHATVASVRSDMPDLSSRQMALMLSVYMVDGAHTVRGLAEVLHISKPAVSRALDRLGELGYIRRERDDMDRRNVLVRRTTAGAVFLNSFAGMIVEASANVTKTVDRDLAFTVEPTSLESSRSSLSQTTSSVWTEVAA